MWVQKHVECGKSVRYATLSDFDPADDDRFDWPDFFYCDKCRTLIWNGSGSVDFVQVR